MNKIITKEQLTSHGLTLNLAAEFATHINHIIHTQPADRAWQIISTQLLTSQQPFTLHYFIFKTLFTQWPQQLDSAPAWIPTTDFIRTTNLARCMTEVNLTDIHSFHAWSVQHYQDFWRLMLAKLHILFHTPPQTICDVSRGVEHPDWFIGASLNITDSCFTAPPGKTALIYHTPHGTLDTFTYAELNQLSNQVANGLTTLGYKPSDAIAIDMPMNHYAVAIYLGIIKMGGIVVSIADSFSAPEISTRLDIANAKAIFTQDFILRDHKKIPLYERIIAAKAPFAIVIPAHDTLNISLRADDVSWNSFLSANIRAANFCATTVFNDRLILRQ